LKKRAAQSHLSMRMEVMVDVGGMIDCRLRGWVQETE